MYKYANYELLNKKKSEFDWSCLQESTVSEASLFCFVALRPESTAMVIAGRSVHLTTLFPGQA